MITTQREQIPQNPQLEIVGLFAEELQRELTINQIGKLLKRPYASVNKYVHELTRLGILEQRKIGSALLCRLNYKNELTIAHLVTFSINKRLRFLKGKSTKELEKLTSVHAPTHTAIIVHDGNRSIILDDKTDFERVLKNLSRITVLNQHEAFWRKVAAHNG